MKASKIILVALAATDALCAAGIIWAGVAFWRSGQNEENAGVLLLAVVLLGIGLLTLAVAVWLLWLARKPAAPRYAIAVAALGLLPPIAFAPFAWDAYLRSTTTLQLACSNLHRSDPRREVAVRVNFYTYFELLHPWIAHQPDTRYQLRDAAGNLREFRLHCPRNAPCTVKNASEQELRAAVSQMLPPCPAPPD